MKSKIMITILGIGLIASLTIVGEAAPIGTTFTFQGRLMDKNKPAEGSYDFQFRLYDSNDPCTGTQLGTNDINDVEAIDGHFIVELDFGSNIFDGNAVWLETRIVQSPMGSDPAALRPLVELTPTPYAIYASNAKAARSLNASDGSPTDAVYVDNDGNVGVGIMTPAYKLDVQGDLHISGNLIMDVPGGRISRPLPIAYAFITTDANVASGTLNVSATWNPTEQWYEITIAEVTYTETEFITMVTPSANKLFAVTNSRDGKLVVAMFALSGFNYQSGFQFITYRP